jgi:hypothetical protein
MEVLCRGNWGLLSLLTLVFGACVMLRSGMFDSFDILADTGANF